MKDFKASGESYSAALRTQPNLLSAWKGLAELHTTTQNYAEAVVAFQALVRKQNSACAACSLNTGSLLSMTCICNVIIQVRIGTAESKEKRQDYRQKLAFLHQKLANFSDAAEQLQLLLHGPLAYTEQSERLRVECQLADLHVSLLQLIIVAACKIVIFPLHCGSLKLIWPPSLWAFS